MRETSRSIAASTLSSTSRTKPVFRRRLYGCLLPTVASHLLFELLDLGFDLVQ